MPADSIPNNEELIWFGKERERERERERGGKNKNLLETVFPGS